MLWRILNKTKTLLISLPFKHNFAKWRAVSILEVISLFFSLKYFYSLHIKMLQGTWLSRDILSPLFMVKFDEEQGDKRQQQLRNNSARTNNEQQTVICDFPTPRDHYGVNSSQYFLWHFSTRMNEQSYQQQHQPPHLRNGSAKSTYLGLVNQTENRKLKQLLLLLTWWRLHKNDANEDSFSRCLSLYCSWCGGTWWKFASVSRKTHFSTKFFWEF